MYVCCVNKSLLNSFLIKKRATARGIPQVWGVFWIDLRESRRQGEIGRLSYAQIISLPPFD